MIEYEGLMALTRIMASFANGEKQLLPLDVTAPLVCARQAKS